MKLNRLTLLAALALTGCATATHKYAPPESVQIQNTKLVGQSFDQTWDKLVRRLSSDFFVINNIDKNSRLINVSFGSAKPSDYVDCGRTHRTFKNMQGEQSFDYVTADSAWYITQGGQGGFFEIDRKSKLDGRINIYIAPEETGTLVSVNTKYVIAMRIYAKLFGTPNTSMEDVTIDLSTKQGYEDKEIRCVANGAIERRVMSLLE